MAAIAAHAKHCPCSARRESHPVAILRLQACKVASPTRLIPTRLQANCPRRVQLPPERAALAPGAGERCCRPGTSPAGHLARFSFLSRWPGTPCCVSQGAVRMVMVHVGGWLASCMCVNCACVLVPVHAAWMRFRPSCWSKRLLSLGKEAHPDGFVTGGDLARSSRVSHDGSPAPHHTPQHRSASASFPCCGGYSQALHKQSLVGDALRRDAA